MKTILNGPGSTKKYTERMKRTSAVLALLAFAAGCDDSVGPGSQLRECVTNITAAQGDSFVELCDLDVPVRHVRIENFRAPATHASAQILFGFDTPPSSSTPELEADQFRVLLYGGGPPFVPPVLQASFGGVDVELGDASFVNDGGTVCFDLHDGSATGAPAFVLWVEGVDGADCGNRATLTAANAYSAVSQWGGAEGSVDKVAGAYFRQSAAGGTAPIVRLFADPVLDEAQIASATTCSTTWAANTDWQQLCAPAVGDVRHIRIDAVESSSNNSYFYAVLGQDPSPTGNPAPDEGKLIITGGRSNSGSSWTWFRFGAASTGQFSYTTDEGYSIYTDGPTSICLDLGSNADGTARLVFWATDAEGADCADPATLTLDNALYDSTTDSTSGEIWNGGLAADKLNFIKTNNSAVSLGAITISSEAAAL